MNQFLSDAAGAARSPRGLAGYLGGVARAAVPAIADFCLVYLLHGEQLRCVASAHATRAGNRLLRALNRIYKITRHDRDSTVAAVVRLGRPSLRGRIRPEQHALDPGASEMARVIDIHRQLAVRSAVVAPIEGRSGVVGAVAFGYAHSGRQYKAADLRIAARVACQIARAVDHARLAQSPPATDATARRLRSAPARPQRPMKPSTGSGGERARLLNELAREERMLTRMLERYMAEYPPPASRASRLRARS